MNRARARSDSPPSWTLAALPPFEMNSLKEEGEEKEEQQQQQNEEEEKKVDEGRLQLVRDAVPGGYIVVLTAPPIRRRAGRPGR